MNDSKYTVFKTTDLYQMLGQVGLPPWEHSSGEMCGGDEDCAPIAEKIKKLVEETKIQDATVIRGQDIFAGPALHEYAGQISTTLEIMDMLGVVPTHPAIEHLRELRQYFSEQAADADGSSIKKIPD